ncbi:hypothetical protein R5R35_001047 [Gryllus longicercus]|uniref:Vacuolar ATPase assembly integral membrane protein VMA21 homolog n=1 Tax=Gryllus longicercus TaxID=2509291 RepID=A0AAN9V4H3_9ORTH
MERRNSESDSGEIEERLFAPEPPKQDSVKVLAVFLLYSMAMFSVPFAAFFGTKYTLKHSFHIEGFANTAWSVVVAVVVINVIILMYACRGYEEIKEEERQQEISTTMTDKRDKSDLNSKKKD